MTQTPTPEQIRIAKEDLATKQEKDWFPDSRKTLLFCAGFTAKALGEPSEGACIAFETRGGSTRLRAKAMIAEIAKECAE